MNLKTISVKILIIVAIIFGMTLVQLFGQMMIGSEALPIHNYSWWEWALQIMWWIMSITFAIFAAEEYDD